MFPSKLKIAKRKDKTGNSFKQWETIPLFFCWWMASSRAKRGSFLSDDSFRAAYKGHYHYNIMPNALPRRYANREYIMFSPILEGELS